MVNDITRPYPGGPVVDRFRFVHHRGQDESSLACLGFTEGGVEVTVNKEFAAADVKILSGLIAPHQSAGFSGGGRAEGGPNRLHH